MNSATNIHSQDRIKLGQVENV